MFNNASRTRMNTSTLSPTRGSMRSPGRMSPKRSTMSPMRSPTRGSMSPSRTVTVGGGQPAPAVKRFPENPTPEAKLRFVFKELDIKDENKVSLDGFRRLLKALNIGFTEATVEDLFERADLNKGGFINYSEFLNFAQHYPLLVEAIYARSKEVFDRAGREDAMTAARDNQASLQRRERDLNDQWERAKERLAAQQRQFENLEESARVAQENLRDRSRELARLQQDVDRVRADRTLKERELIDAKDTLASAQKPLRDTEKNIDINLERLSHAEMALDASRERERELDAMLEEAKRESQRNVDFITETNERIAELREHAAELAHGVEDAQKDVTQLSGEFKEVETALRELKREMELAEVVKADATQNARNLVALTEEERQALIPFRHAESQQNAMHADALRAFEDADQALQELEGQQAAYDQSRLDAEVAEQALLENEVRLREQRKNLNVRDDVLWDEGGHFLRVAGRNDTRIGTTNGNTRGI